MTLEFLLWKRHKNEECIQQLFQIYLNWCLIFQYPSLFMCLSTVKQGQVQPNTVHYRQVQPSTSPPPPSLVSFPDRSRNIRLGHYFANQWRVEVAKWETRNLPCRRIWNMSITNVYHACLAWFWHHIKWFFISFPFKAGSTFITMAINSSWHAVVINDNLASDHVVKMLPKSLSWLLPRLVLACCVTLLIFWNAISEM